MKFSMQIRKERAGFTLVELLVVIAIIGTLVGLLLPAVQAARESARRATCMSNLRDLGLAMLQYSDLKQILPCGSGPAELPTTVRLDYGYAITVLPFIEQQSLYDKIYSDINTANRAVGSNPYIETQNSGRIPTLSCPSDAAVAARRSANASRPSVQPLNYAANWGDVLVGSNSNHTTIASLQMRGPFVNCYCTYGGIIYRNPTKVTKITDGLSRTVLLGEVGVVENATDRTFGLKASVANWSSGATQAAPSSCLNATTWVQPSNNILDNRWGHGMMWLHAYPVFSGFFTILPPNSAPCTTGTSFDGGFHTISSNHLGGAGVVMCDGRVTFISDTIDCGDLSVASPTTPFSDATRYNGASVRGVWGAMGTISRGETLRLTE